MAETAHRYSRTHAQNCTFGPACEGIMGNISTLFKLTQRNFEAGFHRENVSFTRKTANLRF